MVRDREKNEKKTKGRVTYSKKRKKPRDLNMINLNGKNVRQRIMTCSCDVLK